MREQLQVESRSRPCGLEYPFVLIQMSASREDEESQCFDKNSDENSDVKDFAASSLAMVHKPKHPRATTTQILAKT